MSDLVGNQIVAFLIILCLFFIDSQESLAITTDQSGQVTTLHESFMGELKIIGFLFKTAQLLVYILEIFQLFIVNGKRMNVL